MRSPQYNHLSALRSHRIMNPVHLSDIFPNTPVDPPVGAPAKSPPAVATKPPEKTSDFHPEKGYPRVKFRVTSRSVPVVEPPVVVEAPVVVKPPVVVEAPVVVEPPVAKTPAPTPAKVSHKQTKADKAGKK